jgi:gamma-glutamyltranspeptidase/glutathione hydrolase
VGAQGRVATVDPRAIAAGEQVLVDGGSAADAAIAANAVLAVTRPELCGVGGDLLAIVHPGDRAEPLMLWAAGRAGGGADLERLLAEGRKWMPYEHDIRCVPVPGCVDGWVAMHERFGRLPLSRALAPAIELATQLADRPEGIDRVLGAIAENGRAGFYEGEAGAALLAVGEGEFSPDDLATTQAEWRAPLAVDAWGHRLWSTPTPSQGYVTLSAAWIADGLPAPADADDARWAHLLIESMRQAGFDRRSVLHEDADGDALLDPSRLAPRRASIDLERATSVGGSYGVGDTVALTAIDSEGLAISMCQSNASAAGSKLVIPGTGVYLQNRGASFSIDPTHPGAYGPGRRPPHTLAPALVTAPDGRLVALVASEGGDLQPMVLLQLLHRVLVGGAGAVDALRASRWKLANPLSLWDFPTETTVVVEPAAPVAWMEGLVARGHPVTVADASDSAFGHAHLIRVDDDGRTDAASEARP